LPIILPTNVTLTTQGGPVTINVAQLGAGNPGGFRLRNNGSGIAGDPAAPLTLNGQGNTSSIAIVIDPTVATNTASVSNVAITNTLGDGIRVIAGAVTIGGGVVVTGSTNNGLRITGGNVTINNTSGSVTSFSSNLQHGIYASALGSVSITGSPGAPLPSNNGTVLVDFNSAAGIRLEQTVGGAGALNNIDGVVAWGNSNRDILVYGGTKLKLRNSVLGAGPTGLTIANLGVSAAQNDISAIDLGTAADYGRNYFQVPNGALGRHSNSGICVQLATAQATQNVNAAGNFFTTTGNPGTQLNCATGGGTVSTAANCTGGVSFGVNSGTTAITHDFNMCN